MLLVELCSVLLVSCTVTALQIFDACNFEQQTACGTFYISLTSVAFVILRARQMFLGQCATPATEILAAITLPMSLLMVIIFWPTVFALDVSVCNEDQRAQNAVRCGQNMSWICTTIIHAGMPATVWYVALRGGALKRRSFWWTLTLLGLYSCLYGSESETRIYEDVPMLTEIGLAPGILSFAILLLVLVACYAVYVALVTK
jgi:hypothetical protein